MEQLVFLPIESGETAFAYREATLETEWAKKRDLVVFIKPKTSWLGFDHDILDAIPLYQLSDYPLNAGFDESQLWKASLRESRPNFAHLSGALVAQQVAAFLQAWLYHGFLESIVGKKIHVSYLVREDGDGKAYLYSRNLHFCLQARVFAIRQDALNRGETSKNIQLTLRSMTRWVARITHWSHPSFRPKLDLDYPGFMDRLEDTVPAIVRLAEAIEQMRLCPPRL